MKPKPLPRLPLGFIPNHWGEMHKKLYWGEIRNFLIADFHLNTYALKHV
ncbi:MAG: hypothetical protein ACQESX_09910 [Bacteroidota bacterium]